jgi:hypothetical protein
MSFSIPPVQPAQLSARDSIEIVESVGRPSSGSQVSISGPEPDAVSSLVEIPEAEFQAISQRTSHITAPIYTWSGALEKKFGHLAARVAAKKASPDEQRELKALQVSRRRLYLARAGDEVLRDFEKRERTAALIKALKRYVEFTSN